eukprot:595167-Amorphochlora_amoeboformis.AAC.1
MRTQIHTRKQSEPDSDSDDPAAAVRAAMQRGGRGGRIWVNSRIKLRIFPKLEWLQGLGEAWRGAK